CLLSSFFFTYSRPHRYLHSFPTRRSSDLDDDAWAVQRDGAQQPTETSLPPAHVRHRFVTVPPRPAGAVSSRLRPQWRRWPRRSRSEEHTSELQSLAYLVCRLLLEKKKKKK